MNPLLLSAVLLPVARPASSPTPNEGFAPQVIRLAAEASEHGDQDSLRDLVSGDGRYTVVTAGADKLSGGQMIAIDTQDGSSAEVAGPAARYPYVSGSLLAFAPFGGTAHIADLETGAVHDTGLYVARQSIVLPARPHLVVGNGWAGFFVDEFFQGVDLDGDGELTDRVLHVYLAATGEVVNYGIRGDELFANETTLAFSVPEEHALADLNGDGDLDDNVVHLVAPREGLLHNTGLAGDLCALTERIAVLGVPEAAQGATDLNGDGDHTDVVVHTIDVETLDVRNSGLAAFTGHPVTCQAQGERVALMGLEGPGLDFNGDGDTGDVVWHLFDARAGTLVNLGVSVNLFDLLFESASAEYESGLTLTDTVFAFEQSELLDGLDLDGDGVLSSYVRVLHDVAGGELIHTGVSFSAGHPTSAYTVDSVTEVAAGSVDLNGDGDTLDRINMLLDFRAGTYASLGVAWGARPALLPHLALLVVDETQQGFQDLNGDGDPRDRNAVMVLDPRTGESLFPGPTAERTAAVGRSLLFSASEKQDRVDYNGDGDLEDEVLHVVLAPD